MANGKQRKQRGNRTKEQPASKEPNGSNGGGRPKPKAASPGKVTGGKRRAGHTGLDHHALHNLHAQLKLGVPTPGVQRTLVIADAIATTGAGGADADPLNPSAPIYFFLTGASACPWVRVGLGAGGGTAYVGDYAPIKYPYMTIKLGGDGMPQGRFVSTRHTVSWTGSNFRTSGLLEAVCISNPDLRHSVDGTDYMNDPEFEFNAARTNGTIVRPMKSFTSLSLVNHVWDHVKAETFKPIRNPTLFSDIETQNQAHGIGTWVLRFSGCVSTGGYDIDEVLSNIYIKSETVYELVPEDYVDRVHAKENPHANADAIAHFQKVRANAALDAKTRRP